MGDPSLIPPPSTATAPFQDHVDLVSDRVGGAALAASDEFFAEKENLTKAHRAVWLQDEYTPRGKWMDGWESRRKRALPGHDWCVLKLGIPGVIRGVDVDTSYFRGNFPERCSIEGASLDTDPGPADVVAAAEGRWVEILPETALQGHGQNLFPIADPRRFTHLRLNIFPDGGVARLRVHGEAMPDWRRLARSGGWTDLAAIENGATVVECNDMFFGSRHNLIMPGRSVNMGDGWETKRKRKLPPTAEWGRAQADWVIVKLGAAGTIRRVEVDTNWFKGNFPESCQLEGAADRNGPWEELLPRAKLKPHTRHFYEEELRAGGPYSFVRMNIWPDGGISRLRLWGTPAPGAVEHAALAWLNSLPKPAAVAELLRCCGSSRWAEGMADRRPFADAGALLDGAERVWGGATREDWLEAFAAHPRIGSKKDVEKKSGAEKRWAEGEQAGAARASEDTLTALAEANRLYEQQFGHIYLVCATGKTADEMLSLCRSRLANDAAKEMQVAAGEQAKITRIRLEKMLKP